MWNVHKMLVAVHLGRRFMFSFCFEIYVEIFGHLSFGLKVEFSKISVHGFFDIFFTVISKDSDK